MKKTLVFVAGATLAVVSLASQAATTIAINNAALSQYETVKVNANIAADKTTAGGIQGATIADYNVTLGSSPTKSLKDALNEVLSVNNADLQRIDQYSHVYRDNPMDLTKPGTLTYVFQPKASSLLPVKTCVIEFADANIKQVRTVNVPSDAQYCY